MKKDIQRAALAAIVGTLAIMTGCDQSNNSNMKGQGANGKTEQHDMQKPQPPHSNGNLSDPHTQTQEEMHSQMPGGNGGQKKSNGSQYHRYGS